MDRFRRDKLIRLLPDLIKLTDCNIILTSYLRAQNIIGDADEAKLKANGNELERSRELIDILMTRKNGYTFLVEGLKKTDQSGALQLLDETTNKRSAENSTVDLPTRKKYGPTENDKINALPPFKKIPVHTIQAKELFTGRHHELDILTKTLLPDRGAASIIGIGGIGKTELAKMFIHKLDGDKHKNIFQQVIWINCDTIYSATRDFTTVAKDNLNIDILDSSGNRKEISSILNDFYDKLEKSKSLIVLDNVETKEILQLCMPKFSETSKLSVLTTSQNSILKIGTKISLTSLELEGAIELVKKGLDISCMMSPRFENGIKEMVVRLERFPLAISQAIAYIKERREVYLYYEPQNYLSDLDRLPEHLLDSELFIDISSQGKTVFKTLDVTLSKIEGFKYSGELASKILSMVAFMLPDNIPSNFFLQLAESDLALEDALFLVQRFSLIALTPVHLPSESLFSVHRLVQDVLRIRIVHSKETEKILKNLMTLYSLHLNSDLIDHALEAWKHAIKISSIVMLFPNFPCILLEKMCNIGRISDAGDFVTKSIIILDKYLCPMKHASILFELKSYKYFILGLQGNLTFSLENLEITFNQARENLEKDYKIIFKIGEFILKILIETGQNDKAALFCEKLCTDFKLLKENVPLRYIFEIGHIQCFLRRYKDAHTAASYVLSHLHFVSSAEKERDNLEYDAKCLIAQNYGHMGNYDESINLYKEILQTRIENRVNKMSNYTRWQTFHNMGTYQYFAGHFEDAHDTYQKAIKEMEGQDEKTCIFILQTKATIVSLMLVRNMLDRAMPFCIEVYEQIKVIFGEKNFFTLFSLGNIGVSYSKIGRHEEAVKLLTDLMENNSFVTQCEDEARFQKYYLALSLEQMSCFEKALVVLKELKLKCLEYPQYKLHTSKQIESAIKRLNRLNIQ